MDDELRRVHYRIIQIRELECTSGMPEVVSNADPNADETEAFCTDDVGIVRTELRPRRTKYPHSLIAIAHTNLWRVVEPLIDEIAQFFRNTRSAHMRTRSDPESDGSAPQSKRHGRPEHRRLYSGPVRSSEITAAQYDSARSGRCGSITQFTN